MQQATTFFQDHWGDIASVIGVFISIVGFAVTIWGVLRSKNAAQRAESAANAARKSIVRSETVMDLSSALTTMEEVKRLQRARAWDLLPDRYSLLKRQLVSIRASNPALSDEHQTALQSAIQHFSDLEKRIERILSSTKAAAPNIVKLNEIVSAQADKINEILTTIRQEIGV